MSRVPAGAALLGAFVAGCVIRGGPVLSDVDVGGPTVDAGLDSAFDVGFGCRPGETGCLGDRHYRCAEDGLTRLDEEVCPEACSADLGCVACVPGSRRCEGAVSMVCEPDGSVYRYGRNCAEWDVACGDDGYCEDACSEAEARRSYVGCEYFASPLANFRGIPGPRMFDYRIVVANPEAQPAEVTVLRGTRLLVREVVPPGSAVDLALPWIEEVSFPFEGDPWEGHQVEDGAYRVLASRPVIVAQFNPFHYAQGRDFSYTNDASLLLPVHALGREYVGLTLVPAWSNHPTASIRGRPSYLALIGATAGTAQVTLTPSADIAADADGRWPATPAGTPVRLTLRRGEVAEVVPAVPPPCGPDRPGFIPVPGEETLGSCYEADSDLTGSRIVSDGPIEVFGGHTCAAIPIDVGFCDHLEETLAPLDTWGRQFETVPFSDPDVGAPNSVRVVAGYDDTVLTFDPPHPEVNATLDAGEYVDLLIEGPLAITGSRPIEVAQFLLGQTYLDPPPSRGDPSLTMLVPREQFRNDYVFVTPTSYTPAVDGQSWVVISREPGAQILLDGAAVVATWHTVGGRELAVVPLAGGAHRAASTSTFGLMAFGLGSYTSYAYPAGLDLEEIPF